MAMHIFPNFNNHLKLRGSINFFSDEAIFKMLETGRQEEKETREEKLFFHDPLFEKRKKSKRRKEREAEPLSMAIKAQS